MKKSATDLGIKKKQYSRKNFPLIMEDHKKSFYNLPNIPQNIGSPNYEQNLTSISFSFGNEQSHFPFETNSAARRPISSDDFAANPLSPVTTNQLGATWPTYG